MKNKIILSLIFSTVILGSVTCQNSSFKDTHSEEQITKMLKNFYTNLAVICSDPYLFDLDKIDSLKKLNCTSNYYREIENHDMLDYEPLIKAQDFGIDCLKTLTIRKDLKRDDLYYVSYIEPSTKMKVIIKLIIVKEKGLYKIDYVFIDEDNK